MSITDTGSLLLWSLSRPSGALCPTLLWFLVFVFLFRSSFPQSGGTVNHREGAWPMPANQNAPSLTQAQGLAGHHWAEPVSHAPDFTDMTEKAALGGLQLQGKQCGAVGWATLSSRTLLTGGTMLAFRHQQHLCYHTDRAHMRQGQDGVQVLGTVCEPVSC